MNYPVIPLPWLQYLCLEVLSARTNRHDGNSRCCLSSKYLAGLQPSRSQAEKKTFAKAVQAGPFHSRELQNPNERFFFAL